MSAEVFCNRLLRSYRYSNQSQSNKMLVIYDAFIYQGEVYCVWYTYLVAKWNDNPVHTDFYLCCKNIRKHHSEGFVDYHTNHVHSSFSLSEHFKKNLIQKKEFTRFWLFSNFIFHSINSKWEVLGIKMFTDKVIGM